MPSTATITAFYTFTANTKARAAQVNTNFSNYRGHLVAIDPNTQTAIGNTYDLGSSEHYWRGGYFGTGGVNLKSNTSTGADLQIVGDTGASAAFSFKIGGTERFRVNTAGAVINTGTVYQHSRVAMTVTSDGSDPSYGGLARSSLVSVSYTPTAGAIMVSGSTLTISTTGRPLFIGLFGGNTSNSAFISSSGFNARTLDFTMDIRMNTNTLTSVVAAWSPNFDLLNVTTSAWNSFNAAFTFRFSPSEFSTIFPVSSGTNNFFLTVRTTGGTATSNFVTISNTRLLAYEI